MKDGSFDIELLKSSIEQKVDVTREGYELKFLGKSYAKLLASLDTTTVIKPDEEHNSKPENKDSENVYVSGDNIDALKHLMKSYAGQIKSIYIDPHTIPVLMALFIMTISILQLKSWFSDLAYQKKKPREL